MRIFIITINIFRLGRQNVATVRGGGYSRRRRTRIIKNVAFGFKIPYPWRQTLIGPTAVVYIFFSFLLAADRLDKSTDRHSVSPATIESHGRQRRPGNSISGRNTRVCLPDEFPQILVHHTPYAAPDVCPAVFRVSHARPVRLYSERASERSLPQTYTN